MADLFDGLFDGLFGGLFGTDGQEPPDEVPELYATRVIDISSYTHMLLPREHGQYTTIANASRRYPSRDHCMQMAAFFDESTDGLLVLGGEENPGIQDWDIDATAQTLTITYYGLTPAQLLPQHGATQTVGVSWETAAAAYKTWAADKYWVTGATREPSDFRFVSRESTDDASFATSRFNSDIRPKVGGKILQMITNYRQQAVDVGYPDYQFNSVEVADWITHINALASSGDVAARYINGALFDDVNSGYTTASNFTLKDISNSPVTYPAGAVQLNDLHYACPFVPDWQSIIVDASNQAGTGTYVDVVCATSPQICHATDHGHVPGDARSWINGTRTMLAGIDGIRFVEAPGEVYLDLVDVALMFAHTDETDQVPLFREVYGDHPVQTVGWRVPNATTPLEFQSINATAYEYGVTTTCSPWYEGNGESSTYEGTHMDNGLWGETPRFLPPYSSGYFEPSRFTGPARVQAIDLKYEPLFMAYEKDYFESGQDKTLPSTVGSENIAAALAASPDFRINKLVVADFETFDQKLLTAEQRASESKASMQETVAVYQDFRDRIKALYPDALVGFYNLGTDRDTSTPYQATGTNWYAAPPGALDIPEGQTWNDGAELSPPRQETARLAWIRENIAPDISCPPLYPFIDVFGYTDDPDLYFDQIALRTHWVAWCGREMGCSLHLGLSTTSWHYNNEGDIPAQGSENVFSQSEMSFLSSAILSAGANPYYWRYGRYESDDASILQYGRVSQPNTGYAEGVIGIRPEDPTETGQGTFPSSFVNVLDEATFGSALVADRQRVVVADLSDESGLTGVQLNTQARIQGIVPDYTDPMTGIPFEYADVGINAFRNKLGQSGDIGLFSGLGFSGLQPGKSYTLSLFGFAGTSSYPWRAARVAHGTRVVDTVGGVAKQGDEVTFQGTVPPSGALTFFWWPIVDPADPDPNAPVNQSHYETSALNAILLTIGGATVRHEKISLALQLSLS